MNVIIPIELYNLKYICKEKPNRSVIKLRRPENKKGTKYNIAKELVRFPA